jgi:phosphatidylethanolamine-binding protein (PEBP) family uncharacterized protein
VSPARSASTGLILVLALAAFLLSGCGGGSSDPASSSTGSSATSVSAQEGGGGGSSASAQVEKAAGGKANAAANAPAVPGGDGATAPGQKHGPGIAQPKGAPEQAPTPAEIANATVADMTLGSPAVPAASSEEGPGRLAATYTCDGTDSWPELRWSGVPAGSAELILYAMNVQPVEGKLFVDWAVAGLDPSLSGIEAGKLPKGAVIGTNGFGKRGYEICPSGGGEIYIFAIYALPQALSPQRGFDARELRRQILDVSGNVGLLSAAYARG